MAGAGRIRQVVRAGCALPFARIAKIKGAQVLHRRDGSPSRPSNDSAAGNLSGSRSKKMGRFGETSLPVGWNRGKRSERAERTPQCGGPTRRMLVIRTLI
jgi:hypothetical protein